MVRGIDYIAKIDKGVSSMSSFEAEYHTKGDFSLTVFSEQSGEIGLAASSGRIGKVTAFLKLKELADLRKMLIEAKNVIDSARGR